MPRGSMALVSDRNDIPANVSTIESEKRRFVVQTPVSSDTLRSKLDHVLKIQKSFRKEVFYMIGPIE